MGQCPYKLWTPITFEPITNLIVYIHHTVRLIDLIKNNYVSRLANNRFESYGPPKFFKDMSHITNIYIIWQFTIFKEKVLLK